MSDEQAMPHDPSPSSDANPYESPREPQPQGTPLMPGRRPTVLGLIAIAIVTAIASAAAFCCTCFPIGWVGFGISYGLTGSAARIGTVLGWLAFGGGGFVAIVTGYFVARALYRVHINR